MKTLLQRIDQDILDKINNDQEKYPGLAKYIINELHDNYAISDLSFTTIINLNSYAYGSRDDICESQIYKLFA
jgi:hypothetical protein